MNRDYKTHFLIKYGIAFAFFNKFTFQLNYVLLVDDNTRKQFAKLVRDAAI